MFLSHMRKKVPVEGVGESMVVGSFHLHRDTVNRGLGSPVVQNLFRRLSESLRSSGARILGGDANKGLFYFQRALEAQGIQCELAARMSGLAADKAIRGFDAAALAREAIPLYNPTPSEFS